MQPSSFFLTKILRSVLPLFVAFDFALGGVLHQTVDGQFQPFVFFSRKLSNVQQRYSAFDKELLAAFATSTFSSSA